MAATETSALLATTTRLAPVELPAEPLRPLRAVPGHSFEDTPALARALRRGEPEAFQFLHERWNRRILRYCFALSGGDDAFATEVVQAAYLRLFRQAPIAPNEAALWSWMACAIRSSAADLRKVGGRYRRALARFAEWLRFGSGEAAGDAEETRLFAALDRAMSALESEERELIQCRYFQKLPLEVIATRLQTTARAVEGRLARTRARLRALMTGALGKEDL